MSEQVKRAHSLYDRQLTINATKLTLFILLLNTVGLKKLFFIYIFLYNYIFCYSLPPTSLLPGISYEKLAAVFGAKGYQATSVKELKNCLVEMLNYSGSLPQLLNVEILPSSLRKPQVSANALHYVISTFLTIAHNIMLKLPIVALMFVLAYNILL